MRVFGWLLIVFSLLPLLAGLSMDTTVPTVAGGRVHNFGLMQDKQNALLIGALLLIIGIALLIAGRRRQPTAAAAMTALPSGDEKTCPYCAERIKAAAVICRFCNREQPGHAGTTVRPPVQPTPELMAELGITFDGAMYHFGPYRYDRFEDAAAYARKHQP